MSERKAMARRIKDWMEDDRMIVQYRRDGNGQQKEGGESEGECREIRRL